MKNIEWAKSQIDLRDTGTTEMEDPQFYVNVGLRMALDFLEDIDEQEVLSSEWIDNNSVYASFDGLTGEYVHVDDLQNLLVPKQEEVDRAYDKIAESFPATAKEIESVLEKYYSSMLIEFSEELHLRPRKR